MTRHRVISKKRAAPGHRVLRALVGAIAGGLALVAGLSVLAPTVASATSSWNAPADIDGGTSINSVSCGSVAFCVAADSSGNVLTYNGSTWSAALLVDTGNNLNAVSCPTASFCAAGDFNGNVLTFNGTSWTAPVPVAGASIFSLSCTSSTFCMAGDAGGDAYAWNGTSWSAPTSVSAHALDGMSCSSTTFCAAADANGNAFTFNGASWTGATSIDPGNVLSAVSCANATFCEAADNVGNVFNFNGTAWSGATSIDPGNAITAPSCPTTTFCEAVDQNGNAMAFDGTSWSAPTLIDSTTHLSRVSCPTASFCAAVDLNGNALIYATVQTTTCTSGTSCSTTFVAPSQAVAVAGTKAAGTHTTITLSVEPQTLACHNFSYQAPVFTLTDSGFSGTSITVTDKVKQMPSKKGVLVCFQPVGPAPPAPKLLGKCHGKGPVPCIKSVKELSGSAVVALILPTGDPRGHVGPAPSIVSAFTPTSAAPGKSVSITGANLSEATKVTFGGVAATISKRAPTKLTVIVPAHARSGPVTVTSLAGTVQSRASFRVT